LGRTQGLLFRAQEGDRVTFDELINTELAAQSVRVEEDGPFTLDRPKGVPSLTHSSIPCDGFARANDQCD
jgi:hypothetical protein